MIDVAVSLASTPVLRELVTAALSGFSECVRSQGVGDFPDPVPGFIGIGSPYPIGEIPYGHPLLATAVELCRERLAAEFG